MMTIMDVKTLEKKNKKKFKKWEKTLNNPIKKLINVQ